MTCTTACTVAVSLSLRCSRNHQPGNYHCANEHVKKGSILHRKNLETFFQDDFCNFIFICVSPFGIFNKACMYTCMCLGKTREI